MEKSWFKHSEEKEFEKNPNLKREMLKEMRVYLEEQPHLPQTLPDLELIHHIQSCDFHTENAKLVLATNYSIRSNAIFFKNRDPRSTELLNSSQCFRQWLISEINSEGQIAIMATLADCDPSKYVFNTAARHSAMLLDLIRLEHGTISGFVAVVDLKGFTITHLLKAPLGSLRMFMRYLQEGSPLKIAALHLINTKGSIVDKVMVLLRPLLSEKLTKMLFFHQGYETLYDHGFKRDRMPTEYGGTSKETKYIAEESYEQLVKHSHYFQEEELWRIDESKRPRRKKYFGYF